MMAAVKNPPCPPHARAVAELPPLAVRVKEACRLTGMGRSKLYLLIREGHVETIKIGSMTLIPMRSLERLIRTGTAP
jgi:excisionase family DNA binding protein